MANALYAKAKQGLISGAIDLDTAVVKVALVRGYTPNLSTHDFMDDVTGAGGTIVGTPQTLASVTVTDGVFDAADITLTAVTAGAACAHWVVYQASAVTGGADVAASAQRLIALIDDAPVTPNGGDITVQWSNGASKIFAI